MSFHALVPPASPTPSHPVPCCVLMVEVMGREASPVDRRILARGSTFGLRQTTSSDGVLLGVRGWGSKAIDVRARDCPPLSGRAFEKIVSEPSNGWYSPPPHPPPTPTPSRSRARMWKPFPSPPRDSSEGARSRTLDRLLDDIRALDAAGGGVAAVCNPWRQL